MTLSQRNEAIEDLTDEATAYCTATDTYAAEVAAKKMEVEGLLAEDPQDTQRIAERVADLFSAMDNLNSNRSAMQGKVNAIIGHATAMLSE